MGRCDVTLYPMANPHRGPHGWANDAHICFLNRNRTTGQIAIWCPSYPTKNPIKTVASETRPPPPPLRTLLWSVCVCALFFLDIWRAYKKCITLYAYLCGIRRASIDWSTRCKYRCFIFPWREKNSILYSRGILYHRLGFKAKAHMYKCTSNMPLCLKNEKNL